MAYNSNHILTTKVYSSVPAIKRCCLQIGDGALTLIRTHGEIAVGLVSNAFRAFIRVSIVYSSSLDTEKQLTTPSS